MLVLVFVPACDTVGRKQEVSKTLGHPTGIDILDAESDETKDKILVEEAVSPNGPSKHNIKQLHGRARASTQHKPPLTLN